MEPLAIMTVLSSRAMTEGAYSALPDAPVVPMKERTPARVRSRAAAAAVLHRLADAVAPPARPTVCVGGQ
jgi:hypothetical protein